MDAVTWNENVMAVDSDGHIGYWHPGLHQLKPKTWDERLPLPGHRQGRVARLPAAGQAPAGRRSRAGLARAVEQRAVGGLDQRRLRGARAGDRLAPPRRHPAQARAQGREEPELQAQHGHRAHLRHHRPAVPASRQGASSRRRARAGERRRSRGARRRSRRGTAPTTRRTGPGPSIRASRSGRSSRTRPRRSS